MRCVYRIDSSQNCRHVSSASWTEIGPRISKTHGLILQPHRPCVNRQRARRAGIRIAPQYFDRHRSEGAGSCKPIFPKTLSLSSSPRLLLYSSSSFALPLCCQVLQCGVPRSITTSNSTLFFSFQVAQTYHIKPQTARFQA